ncbi:hypothetical protein NW768_002130 [Fusarium equiseti]|uniref:Pheromone protein 1 n=1 Tax=Fusarium equiseti TaxID=61235 RepID=A0ABQ8RML9_FUSEQ|nr:hypothetical protein NW768_002130 [Fusarium equiseti]
MKYSVLTLVAVAGTALAMAVPDPMPHPVAAPVAEANPKWCQWKGQPCSGKTKREAQPEPVAAPQPDPVAEADPKWCQWKGQPCSGKKTKREAQPEPEPKWCQWKGQPCWKAKREAAPEPEAKWCQWKGQPCSGKKTKREAVPEPKWCMWKGQPCWKAKRDAGVALSNALLSTRDLTTRSIAEIEYFPRDAAHQAKRSIVELANVIALSARGNSEEYFKSLDLEESFPDLPDNTNAKREAAPEPEPKWCQWKGQPCSGKKTKREAVPDPKWCQWKGQPCWKAKRAAEAVLAAVEGEDGAGTPGGPEEHFDTSDFNPENFADKRDLMAIKAAARSVVDALEG